MRAKNLWSKPCLTEGLTEQVSAIEVRSRTVMLVEFVGGLLVRGNSEVATRRVRKIENLLSLSF
jgi:hypothetical protein